MRYTTWLASLFTIRKCFITLTTGDVAYLHNLSAEVCDKAGHLTGKINRIAGSISPTVLERKFRQVGHYLHHRHIKG